MAPVIRALAEKSAVESRVCLTAQHRQMVDQVFALFQIQPDYDLDLMQEDQSLPQLSAAIFTSLDPVLEAYRPEWVLIQGDTTTVAIAALLSYYRRIRVGHVEAGLRTHDKWQPFPEEINRRVAGVAADLHFAPTESARQNLLREAVQDASIVVTGNPVIDALQYVAAQPEPPATRDLLESLGIPFEGLPPTGGLKTTRRARRPGERALCLVTAHRRESFGIPLEGICNALRDLAARGDIEIVYPVHPNPHVQEPVRRLLGGVNHITLVPPLDYSPLVHLMKHATLILTDSGGIQEEATAFGVPVLVLRDVTERPEGIQAGTLKLAGTDRSTIVELASQLLDDSSVYASMAQVSSPFGDGHAAAHIVNALLKSKLQ